MQVKFKRTRAMKGLLGGKHVFQLSVMILPNEGERGLFDRHGWWDRMLDVLVEQADSDGNVASFRCSFRKLVGGASFEHQNMNVVFKVEAGIIEECKIAIASCRAIDTFDGTDRVIEIKDGEHALVALD